MRHTNIHDYSNLLATWLLKDDYDYVPGVRSATQLLKPVQATILRDRHEDAITVDISELIPRRIGTAIHESMEDALKDTPTIGEQRVRCQIKMPRGGSFTISGKFDRITIDDQTGTLWDWKYTSVYKFIKEEVDDYRRQLSIYRYILLKNSDPNYPPLISDEGMIVFFFNDWMPSKARTQADYPKTRVMEFPVTLYGAKEIERWIQTKLELLALANAVPDASLPECSKADLWMDDDKWAVMKEGRKSAVKLHGTEESATLHMESMNGNVHYLEQRKALAKRCEYCEVRGVCHQFKRLQDEGRIAEGF